MINKIKVITELVEKKKLKTSNSHQYEYELREIHKVVASHISLNYKTS